MLLYALNWIEFCQEITTVQSKPNIRLVDTIGDTFGSISESNGHSQIPRYKICQRAKRKFRKLFGFLFVFLVFFRKFLIEK